MNQPTTAVNVRSSVDWRSLLGPVGVLAAVLASAPYVLIYLKNLWEQPHYQFFPLVLAAVGYLAYQRWGTENYQPSPTWSGFAFKFVRLTLLAGGICGTLCATTFASPWMGYFGFACSLAAWFAYRRDSETGGSLLHLALPMALIWQPPYDTIRTGDTILIQQLQIISARLSSKILDILGYIHFQPGTVLQVPGSSFGVAEACSGIQSFFAVLCVGALLVAYFRRGLVRSALLLATSPFWAVLMNTVRITVIPIAYSSFGVDLSHGLLHDLLGYTTMGLAIALMLSTDELLAGLEQLVAGKANHLQTSNRTGATAAETGQSHGGKLAKIALWPAGLLFAACCSIQSYDAYQSWSIQRDSIDFFRDGDLLEMSKSVMPGELAGWNFALYDRQERGRNNDDLGERSDMWYFEAPFGRVSVSFDQRFPGWHELTRCYRNAGWSPEKRLVLTGESVEGWPVVRVLLKRRNEFGCLHFTLKTEGGSVIQPPGAYTYWTILQERLRGRLTPAVRGALFGTTAYQFQLFASGSRPFNEAEVDALFSRFLLARETLWTAAEREITLAQTR